jgi:nitrite reductase (NO-forming)
LTGEEGHNPDFVVNSGDEVTFTVTNAGKGFHSFGITASPDDFSNPLWGSEIASSAAPLKAGESGSATFIAGVPGTYYYICTVPGHASLGMQGSFIVE